MKKFCVLLLIVVLWTGRGSAWFSDGNAGYPLEYLTSFSGGARGLGLGLAQSALDGQVQLMYSNPASIASLWWQEASFSIVPLFDRSQFVNVAYGHPLGNDQALGLSLVRLTSGDAEKTNGMGETLGTFSDQETTAILGYGRRMGENLQCGVNMKFMAQDIDTASHKSVSADAGLIYRPSPDHAWALSFLNVIPTNFGKDAVPLILKAGFRHRMINDKLFLTADLYPLDVAGGAWSLRWAGGLEFRWPENIFWRAGVNQKQASAGIGLSFRQVDFDYSLVYHPLDFLHTFTLTLRYGFVPSEAEQKVKREWSDLEAEKDAFRARKKEEERKVRGQYEKLRREERAMVMIVKARREFEDKKYEDAKQTLRGVLNADPSHEEARRLFEEIKYRQDAAGIASRLKDDLILYQRGRYAEVLKDLAFILAIQPENQEALALGYLARAQLYITEKKYREAKGELIEILKIDPAHRDADQLLKRLQTILDLPDKE